MLPVAFDLSRRRDRAPSRLRVAETTEGWRVTLAFADEGDSDGLASAPIRSVG